MQHIQTGHWDARPLVNWSTSPPEHSLAIADGVLKVREHTRNNNLWSVIGNTERANWQLLHDKTTKFTLANWEFKSLSVGSDDVMDIVYNMALGGSFRWDTCHGGCSNHSKFITDAASDTFGQDAMWSSTATWLGDGMTSFPAWALQANCSFLECSSELPDRNQPAPDIVEPESPPGHHSASEVLAHSMFQQVCYLFISVVVSCLTSTPQALGSGCCN
jgi:hypothetical protein